MVARDVELFLSGRGRNAEGVYSPAVLRSVAPFAVLLHRRVTLLSSAPAPATARVAGPDPHALLLPRLCQSATAVGEHALAELLDWAAISWSGRTTLRYFYAGRALPEPLRQSLQEALDTRGAVMRRVTGSLVLRDRAEHLRAEANRLAAVDQTFTRSLFVKPVEAVLHDLSRGVTDDHGLLAHPVETLLARANAERHGNLAPVPTNGKRWPVLVKNTTEVRELVRGLLEVAAEHAWDGPELPAPPLDALDPGLVPVVEALLFASPDLDAPRTGEDGSWVTEVAAEALSLAAPEHRHMLALCARGAGVPAESTRLGLEPIDRIRTRAEELFRALARDPDGQGEDLRSLIMQSLDRGDLPEARDGLDMLEEYASRTAVETRAAAVREALTGIADEHTKEAVRLHLSTVELHLERDDVAAAESYVTEAEAALPPASRSADDATSEEPPVRVAVPVRTGGDLVAVVPPPGVTGTALDEGLLERILAAVRAPDHQAPDRRRLEQDVRTLGRTGVLDDVVSMARDLMLVAPDLALALTEPALERSRPVLRPLLWQLQLDALRALGESARADQVFALGHPPLPPEDLTVGEPVTGAHLLLPRVRPFQQVADPAEAVPAETAPRSPAEEAQLYARSLGVGNTSSLGFAIGWTVEAGTPAEGLRLYGRFGPRQYLNAAAAWNVAVAYAQTGHARSALDSLVVFQEILSGRMEPSQRRGMEQFLFLHGARPAPPAPLSFVPGQFPAQPEEEAKRLHAAGRVEEARASLDRLLTTNPRSPGAFLLLRIHREQRDLAAARRAVDLIETAGAATWRHHLELARNALDAGDLVLARQRLDRAQGMGAAVSWTAPLLNGVLRASAAQSRVQGPGPVPVPGPSRVPEAPATSGAQPFLGSDDPEQWRQHISGQLYSLGLPAMLESPEWTSRREPAVVGMLTSQLRTQRVAVPGGPTLERLISLVNQYRDSFLNRDLALWLMNNGDHRAAVRVLQDAVAWTPPDRLPRVIFLRDEAVRRGGLPVEDFDPPSPPSGVTGPKQAPDLSFVPLVHLQAISGPQAGTPSILEAQRLPRDTAPSVVADAWVRAVHDGQSLALGNALGTLARAGRFDEAVALHHGLSTVYWLGAAAAWNLGCVYAGAGHLDEAATCFLYHARISTRQYTEGQLHAVTALFSSLGRPVPTPAGLKPALTRNGNPPAAPTGLPVAMTHIAGDTPAGLAARRIAEFLSAPANHRFYIAGTAVRKAMQAGPQTDVSNHVATMQNLFSALPRPTSKAAAELAAVMEAGGQRQEAWDLLVKWIDATGAEAALLAPVVRISRDLDRERQLRELLERHHRPDAGYELNLNLAKLAQRQGDRRALLKYADLALRRNPVSVEAAVMRESVVDRQQPLTPDKREILRKVKDPRVSEPEAVQLLVHEYASDVKALQSKALTWFQPEIDWRVLAREVPAELRAEAEPAFQAAAARDWERAANLFRELLTERAPRSIALVRATVVCLLQSRLHEEAEVVAGVVGHLPDGVRLQVQIAAHRGAYGHAHKLLALFRTVRDGSVDEALAQAGLMAHLATPRRPSTAAGLLLNFARLRPPGTSDLPLALAVGLAHRNRKQDQRPMRQALRELRRPEAGPDQLVTWAIQQDTPESLHKTNLLPLGRALLERVVQSLEGDQERLLRFVGAHLMLRASDQGSTAREERQYCAEVLGRHGLVRDAYAEWRALAEEAPGQAEQLRVLGELRAFSDGLRFAEGYRHAVVNLLRLGVEVGEEAMVYADTLSSEEEPSSLPPETEELVSRAAAGTHPPLSAGLAAAAAALKAEAGPRDAESLERLGTLWTGIAVRLEVEDAVSLLAGSALRDSAAATLRVESDMRLQALLARNLISAKLREAATRLSDALNAAWEEVARTHLRKKSERDGRLLELKLLRVTRIGTGPVEAKVEITALRSMSQITVIVEGAGPDATVRLNRLEADSKATLLFVLPGEHEEVTVTASGVMAQGPQPSKTASRAVSHSPSGRRLMAHFKPSDRVDPAMFVGRTKELEDLSRHYEKASRSHGGALFITGSRQAGKTSIAYQLSEVRSAGTQELRPPDKWRIPRVFPVYLNAEMTEHSDCPLMTDIAKAVGLAVARAFDDRAPAIGMPEGSSPLDFLSWWRHTRRQLWPTETVGLLLIIDEFQHLLRRLKDAGDLDPVLSQLRGLKNEGLALLFCGAATTQGIRDLLEGTRFQQDFTTPYIIGPLDNDATRQAFHLGFLEPVQVMDEAAERVWELTQGHPQHIHMLGSRVLDLLHERQRTHVSAELVDEAFTSVVKDDDAVIGLLDPYGEGGREHALSLLYEIAGLIEDDADVTAVRASLATAKGRDLDGLHDFGILVKRQGQWAWVNQIVRAWLELRRPRNAERRSLGWEADEQLLRDGGYVVERRLDEPGRPKRLLLAHPDRSGQLVAQHHPGHGPRLDRLHRIFSDSVQHVEGVPEIFPRSGEWLLFRAVNGVSLQDKLDAKLAGTLDIGPAEATRWIVDACDTLYRMRDARGLTHGDIRPENLVLHGVDESELFVLGWGSGRDLDGDEPLLPPGPSDYRSPQVLKGMPPGLTEADDAFALSAILYRLLHPTGALPYGDEESLEGGPALLPDDGPLSTTVMRGVFLRPANRFQSPMELRAALSAAVPELRPVTGPPDHSPAGDAAALRSLLSRFSDELDRLRAHLTAAQTEDVDTDHHTFTRALQTLPADPARAARFARRLRDTLESTGPASAAAVAAVDAILGAMEA
ncbi:hypothetical protein ACIQKB_19215 [Streptomyces sp. NPDC092046]|uniref:hypothetical protein n=1 Tax=Streptomyces sp. NPDC092046 TaxID=3366009 RepID=UPI00380F66B1